MKGVQVKDYHKDVPGAITKDGIWAFPPIRSINKNGKTLEWQIFVTPLKDGEQVPFEQAFLDNKQLANTYSAMIKVDSGQTEGVVRASVPTYVKTGKNKGRANETNVICQALRDALGIYNKQARKATTRDTGTTAGFRPPPPMLAQVYDKRKAKVQFPVFVQKKYNGIRAVAALRADSTVGLFSRRSLEFPGFAYVGVEIERFLTMKAANGMSLCLDGELYSHGMRLQELSGHVRRAEASTTPKLQYMIFDCFVIEKPDLIFTERNQLLDEFFATSDLQYCKRVETFIAKDEKELFVYRDQFLADKYEGAIVRIDTPYEFSYNEHHSDRLLKVKPSYDAEYEIIGWTRGKKGKASNALMINCKTADGKEFAVTPAMPITERNKLADKMEEKVKSGPNEGKTKFEAEWLGKMITVTYDEESADGVPQRARTELVVRGDE
jgi:ATP-dependent DNA ligase